MRVSQERPEFAEELPKFVVEIKRIFTPHQILEFFDDLQAGLVPDPAKVFNMNFEAGELDEHEVQNDADCHRECKAVLTGIGELEERKVNRKSDGLGAGGIPEDPAEPLVAQPGIRDLH